MPQSQIETAVRNEYNRLAPIYDRYWYKYITNSLSFISLGVDISESMLAIAKNKLQSYPNLSLHLASVASLPFANESFDIVICANAFHYFESSQLALTEMKRVLKPDGEVIILDWCKDYIFCQIWDVWLKIIDPAHQQCYTLAELNHLLTAANFKIIKDSKVRLGIIWELIAVTAV